MSQEILSTISSADKRALKCGFIHLLDNNLSANIEYIRRRKMGFLEGCNILASIGDVELPADELEQIAAKSREELRQGLERAVRHAETTDAEKKQFVQLLGRCLGAIQYTSGNNPDLNPTGRVLDLSIEGQVFLGLMIIDPLYAFARSDMETSRLAFLFARRLAMLQSRSVGAFEGQVLNGEPRSMVSQSFSMSRSGPPTPSEPSAATMPSIHTSAATVRLRNC
jgi:hypothetical protein